MNLDSKKVTIYKSSKQQTSIWSGGKTTQLYLDPPEAQVANRDFNFRISTASVEVEDSEFTPFPGYERILLVLEGKLHISHENHYELELPRYAMDRFSGSWITRSKGKVRDFNVIYKPDLNVELRVQYHKAGERFTVSPNSEFIAYFLEKGSAECEEFMIERGDFITIHESIEIHVKTSVILVKVRVFNK